MTFARAALALVATAAGGCGKSSKPARRDDAAAAAIVVDARSPAPPVREVVILREVIVDVVAPSGGQVPGKDALAARLRRLGDGVVADAGAIPAGWAGRTGAITAALTYDLGGTARAPVVLMTIEAVVDLDGDALGAAARAAGEKPAGKNRAAAVDGLAGELIDQIAAELTRKLTLRAAPEAALATAAAGDDAELAAWALELGGERQDPALHGSAVAALARTPRLRTAAIQYLVALGDPSAVHDLTASVDFAEPEELAAIVEAVTALGGDDARAFLEMLAAGASDKDLADRAKEGLDRLDRREDAGP